MAEITLPPVASLSAADDQTLTSVLDLLFEPSPEIHRIAIPVIRQGQNVKQDTSTTNSRIPANPGLSAELGNKPTETSSTSFKSTTVPSQNEGLTPSVGVNTKNQEFDTYAAMIRQIGDRMFDLVHASATMTAGDPSSRQELHSILGSHPRLGAKKVDSALSRAEQSQLNTSSTESVDPSKETEAQALARLNAAYEVRFPGLRYVVFVNGRGRDVIMENMKERIDRGDIRAEEKEGVQAMVDIALDRARKILSA